MKVLWLCNTVFSDSKIAGNGSWLQPLAEAIQRTGTVQVMNVALGDVKQVIQQNHKGIKQWIIPIGKTYKYGQIASTEACETVATIIKQNSPDIVHIWGTESIWASIKKQGYIKPKTLLDIQGLLFAYTDYYYGGLTIKEIFQSVHLKEILMPWRILFNKKRIFYKRGVIEKDCLKDFEHISYQSQWVRDQIKQVLNPYAQFYSTRIMLREAFYTTAQWEYKEPSTSPIIFTSTSAAVTYKGLHVLIKAIALLKNTYPNIQLRVAGNVNVGNKLQDGYSVFLNHLIDTLGLKNNVLLIGSLNEDKIIEELLDTNVCVIPSFIETYCLAFAEAMLVGVPTIASYAGAMPELAEHRKEALFYNSLDHAACAAKIEELIQNKNLAEHLSVNGRARRLKENNKMEVVDTQMSIYKKMVSL